MEKLHQDYREFIELLNENNADYLIVGAFAMAFHGHPRNTGDIDFWIRNNNLNAGKVFNVIKNFGFPINEISERDFTSSDLIFQIGYPPVRIDILTSVEALNFDESFKNKEVKTIDGLNVNFLNLEDLKINKKAVGRKKDIADLEQLQRNK
ncbi:MAG: nucleotidyltransferase [Bacteroidota bacterium]|nr:nucleotidyltransferase [Bacteroidota bacterium]